MNLFLEINNAFVDTPRELRICSQLLIDFLAAGVKNILRSLFPFPTPRIISFPTWSRFRLANSDRRRAQFRKIVMMQWSLG